MIEDIEQYANFISYLEDKINEKHIELRSLEEVLSVAKSRMNKVIGIKSNESNG